MHPAHTHLQRDDNHKDLLLLVRQDVFHEGPACADQCQCNEEKSSFEPEKHINTNVITVQKVLNSSK